MCNVLYNYNCNYNNYILYINCDKSEKELIGETVQNVQEMQ